MLLQLSNYNCILKRFYLFFRLSFTFGLFLFSIFGWAQQPIGNHYPNMVRTEQSIRTPNDDCSQSNPGNNFEFFGAIDSDDQMVATDILVEANEVFTLEQIIVYINSDQGTLMIDVTIRNDENDLPSSIFAFEQVIPFTQIGVGTDPITGFTVFETPLDLITPVALSGGPSGTRYWVQLKAYPISPSQPIAGWEHTSATQVGLPIAFTNKAGEWMLGSTLDGVYIFNGDCQTLDTEDNALNSLEIYPNPADSEITIATSLFLEEKDVQMYSIAGQHFSVPFSNNRMDVSSLPVGIYLLKIEKQNGFVVKKVIIE